MKNVFEVLKSEGYECSSTLQDYYSEIDSWRLWWQGYVPKFHKYKATDINKNLIEMKRNSLKMAKKVSEDWANLLLTDKTVITVDETIDVGTDEKDDAVDNVINESQKFLSGDAVEQNGGVLGLSKFWTNGNKTLEKAYALGTAAYIIVPKKAVVLEGKLSAESVMIKYIKDAGKIIPLSWDDTGISECAFASNKTIKGKSYLYLQIMKSLEDGRYEVINKYYLKESDSYTATEIPTNEVLSYIVPAKNFFIIQPNIENNVSDAPLGISTYANAIDQLKSCDLAFDNLCNDFFLGRKKVYMSQEVISVTNVPVLGTDGLPMKDSKGQPVFEQKPLAGEAIEQTLYVNMGSVLPGSPKFFEEYNPTIRVEENKEGIQFFLNLLSSKVGFGQSKYRFDVQSMSTATEVKASNKDLTESVWKQRTALQDVLVEMSRSILTFGKVLCGLNVNPDAKIAVTFDDSMFSDDEAIRLRDLQEVRDGIMPKWEYRVKHYGDNKKTAMKMVSVDTTEPGISFQGVK